jgi:chaperonin GroES
MSTKPTIQPLGKRVLVQPDELEQVTKGGLVLPPSASDDKRPATGTVLTLGIGKRKGEYIKFDVKIGDKVYFKKYSPEEIEVEGKKYFLLDTDDILAILK